MHVSGDSACLFQMVFNVDLKQGYLIVVVFEEHGKPFVDDCIFLLRTSTGGPAALMLIFKIFLARTLEIGVWNLEIRGNA